MITVAVIPGSIEIVVVIIRKVVITAAHQGIILCFLIGGQYLQIDRTQGVENLFEHAEGKKNKSQLDLSIGYLTSVFLLNGQTLQSSCIGVGRVIVKDVISIIKIQIVVIKMT